jgi:hypothetical protein
MKLTNKQKRHVLARFTECQVAEGNGLDWIFAKPLNWFDFDKLIALIHKTERGSQMEMNEDELFTI